MKEYSKSICITMLCEMSAKLASEGITRYPQRSDFSDDEVIAIKSFLGPWPRALEKAGLKPVNEELNEKKRKKRIASRIKKRQYKLEARKIKKQNAENA